MEYRLCHKIHVALLMLLFVPGMAQAQLGFDVVSVEALIDDHKRVRSVLLARSSVEQANEVLHQYTKDATIDYKDINEKLDRYHKAFDVIDLIYNGGTTVLNVVNTSKDVTERIGQVKELIEKFGKECTLKGNILSSDTIIINTCQRTIVTVGDEGERLVKSLYDLALYATGASHITTEGMMTVMDHINESLDNIRHSIDHAYYVIWKYVTIRTHYWKKELYRAKNLREIANDAFSRWRYVTETVGY